MFKKELTAALISSTGERYILPVYADVSFSQVFSEAVYPRKTLHNPNRLIAQSKATTLNPGNFSFTLPILATKQFAKVLKEFCEDRTFSLILENKDNHIYRRCVATSVVFNLDQDAVLTVSVSGQFTHGEDMGGRYSFDEMDREYTHISGMEVSLDRLEVEHLTSVNVEIAKRISWIDNSYLHDTGPLKPRERYTLEDMNLSGTLIKNEGLNLPEFSDNSKLKIRVKSNNDIFMEIYLPDVSYTTRQQLDAVIKKGIDFKAIADSNRITIQGVNIL